MRHYTYDRRLNWSECDPGGIIFFPHYARWMVDGLNEMFLGFGVDPSGRHNDGTLMIVLNPGAFRPADQFKREVAEFARYIAATPPAPGVERVYHPGELEYLTEQKRGKEGIPIEDRTWQNLVEMAARLELSELVR